MIERIVVQGTKHALARTFSVVCTLLVIAGIGWAIYITVIRPHTKGTFRSKQEAENIVNYNTEVKPSFGGCAHFKILGTKKNDQVANSE